MLCPAKYQRRHPISISILQSFTCLVLSQALSCQVLEAKFHFMLRLAKYQRIHTIPHSLLPNNQRPHTFRNSILPSIRSFSLSYALSCQVPETSFIPLSILPSTRVLILSHALSYQVPSALNYPPLYPAKYRRPNTIPRSICQQLILRTGLPLAKPSRLVVGGGVKLAVAS